MQSQAKDATNLALLAAGFIYSQERTKSKEYFNQNLNKYPCYRLSKGRLGGTKFFSQEVFVKVSEVSQFSSDKPSRGPPSPHKTRLQASKGAKSEMKAQHLVDSIRGALFVTAPSRMVTVLAADRSIQKLAEDGQRQAAPASSPHWEQACLQMHELMAGVNRVRCYMRVPVTDDTLRIGYDGKGTIHVDPDLQKYLQSLCRTCHVKEYVLDLSLQQDGSDLTCIQHDRVRKNLSSQKGNELHSSTQEVLSHLEPVADLSDMPSGGEGSLSHFLKEERIVHQTAKESSPKSSKPTLPFDLEVHMTPSGVPIVLDPNRLLLPDMQALDELN